MEKLKLELSHAFEMTDCGEAHHFLGIKINRSQGNLTIDQCHYIDQILSKFGMKECKSVITPLIKLNSLDDYERDDAERDDVRDIRNNINRYTTSSQLEEVDQSLYQQIIGSLMFLMIGSRPDLAVAISFLSQSMSNPSPHHMQAAKRVLRYIKGTRDLKLHLGNRNHKNDGITLTGFSDANWGNDAETR